MGRYLDILRRLETETPCDQSDKSDQTPPVTDQADTFGRFGRFCRTFHELERRCPERVEFVRWQQGIADARVFLAGWSQQAEALGWTSSDLFGLHQIPDRPAANYQRLSRYDCTGLLWLLQGRPVVALTEATAAIQTVSGGILNYRKHNKPALGPVGDSLDDLGAGR